MVERYDVCVEVRRPVSDHVALLEVARVRVVCDERGIDPERWAETRLGDDPRSGAPVGIPDARLDACAIQDRTDPCRIGRPTRDLDHEHRPAALGEVAIGEVVQVRQTAYEPAVVRREANAPDHFGDRGPVVAEGQGEVRPLAVRTAVGDPEAPHDVALRDELRRAEGPKYREGLDVIVRAVHRAGLDGAGELTGHAHGILAPCPSSGPRPVDSRTMRRTGWTSEGGKSSPSAPARSIWTARRPIALAG